jgi:hypothetical protein
VGLGSAFGPKREEVTGGWGKKKKNCGMGNNLHVPSIIIIIIIIVIIMAK